METKHLSAKEALELAVQKREKELSLEASAPLQAYRKDHSYCPLSARTIHGLSFHLVLQALKVAAQALPTTLQRIQDAQAKASNHQLLHRRHNQSNKWFSNLAFLKPTLSKKGRYEILYLKDNNFSTCLTPSLDQYFLFFILDDN